MVELDIEKIEDMIEEQKLREAKEEELKDRADRFGEIYEKHNRSKVF